MISEKLELTMNRMAGHIRQFDFVDFALLFGSFAEGRENRLSDIDIGVFLNKDIELIQRGKLVAGLEFVLARNVDILILNGLYIKNTLLSFEIVSRGKLLFCRDEDALTAFKRKTFLYFMDTRDLRDMVNTSFKKRLLSGKFGECNYDSSPSTA